jgi:hypothetical protein
MIQDYPEDLDLVNAMLKPRKGANSFLEHFLEACLHADSENYEIMRPMLMFLVAKYPPSAKDLSAEQEK